MLSAAPGILPVCGGHRRFDHYHSRDMLQRPEGRSVVQWTLITNRRECSMSSHPHERRGPGLHPVLRLCLVAALLCTAIPSGVRGQDAATRMYLLAAGCHYRVPASEVEVLARWSIPPEEIPVGLFLASRAGVSPEVIFSLRRTRNSWADLAGRYGLGAAAFHVPLNGASAGELSRAYAEFDARSPREWDEVQLSDGEIVTLVNLRFLTESLGIPASRVLDARAGGGSWPAVFAAVGGRGC